jgi:hypothetical protein
MFCHEMSLDRGRICGLTNDGYANELEILYVAAMPLMRIANF